MEFIGSNYPQVKGISPTDRSRKHELHKPLDKIIITLYIEKPFTRQNSLDSKVFGFKVPTLNSGFKISGDMSKQGSFHFGFVLLCVNGKTNPVLKRPGFVTNPEKSPRV